MIMDILIKNTNFNNWSEQNWLDWLENLFIHGFISPIDLSLSYGMEVREMMTYLFKNGIETVKFEKAIITLISEYLQFHNFTYRISILIDGLNVSRLSESEDLMLKIYKDVNLGKKSHNGLFLSTKVMQHFREKNILKKDITNTLIINSRSYLSQDGDLSLAFLNNYLSFLNKHISSDEMISFLIEYIENYKISNTKEETKIKAIIYDKLLEITYTNEAGSIVIIYQWILTDFRSINKHHLFKDALIKLKVVIENRLCKIIEKDQIDTVNLAIDISLNNSVNGQNIDYSAVKKIYQDLENDEERTRFFKLNPDLFTYLYSKTVSKDNFLIKNFLGENCFNFFKASSADINEFILNSGGSSISFPVYSNN